MPSLTTTSIAICISLAILSFYQFVEKITYFNLLGFSTIHHTLCQLCFHLSTKTYHIYFFLHSVSYSVPGWSHITILARLILNLINCTSHSSFLLVDPYSHKNLQIVSFVVSNLCKKEKIDATMISNNIGNNFWCYQYENPN